VFLCVVDPGVGSNRGALVARAGGRWFVGPDNGLLAIAVQRDPQAEVWTIDWRPEALSASFHGRDLFAPVAGALARGDAVPGEAVASAGIVGAGAPPDVAQIVYIDGYGNAMTGLRAATLPADAELLAGDRRLVRGRTFSDVPPGEGLWYENSSGLAEIAVNQGRADRTLGLAPGAAVTVLGPAGGA
jgi:hypothetical protein